jgi:hypothetical protein
MQVAHEVGPGFVEDLGAVLMPEIIALDIERHPLHAGTGAAVAEKDFVAEDVE